MGKVMSLLPSLRERKRYLAYKIISKDRVNDSKLVSRLIKAACLRFLGELGMSRAGIIVLEDKYNSKTQKGLVRVNNKYLNELRASLALINEKNMIFTSIGASGILKKAEERYLKEGMI